MNRKDMFEAELIKAEKDFNWNLSQPGVNRAWGIFNREVDKAEKKDIFTDDLFGKEGPGLARLLVLNEIMIDNEAKAGERTYSRIIIQGASHSFGE